MTPADPPGPLADQARRFGDDIRRVVEAAFDVNPDVDVRESEGRFVVKMKDVPLKANGEALATLKVSIRCCPDSAGKYIAVEKSAYVLSSALTREPIVRFDYDRQAHSKPSSHVQLHAHRGELTHLLTRTGHKAPHSIASLHFPTGGPRFRPSIEDITEFLIRDCGFDGCQGWRQVVEESRIAFRKIQVRSVVRDAPEEAAAVLTDLGYTVQKPERAATDDKSRALSQW